MKKFNSLVRPKNEIRKKEYKDFLFVTIHKLLEFIPIEYVKNSKINVSNKIIDFNGTINYYYMLSDFDQTKFYFKNKIFIYDNINDDIKIICSDLKFNSNSYILKIINKVIDKYS